MITKLGYIFQEHTWYHLLCLWHPLDQHWVSKVHQLLQQHLSPKNNEKWKVVLGHWQIYLLSAHHMSQSGWLTHKAVTASQACSSFHNFEKWNKLLCCFIWWQFKCNHPLGGEWINCYWFNKYVITWVPDFVLIQCKFMLRMIWKKRMMNIANIRMCWQKCGNLKSTLHVLLHSAKNSVR